MLHQIRQYFQILGTLLRREEDNRRHAPFESLANLLEPIFLISMMSFFLYFLGRRQLSALGGPPILFYATGFFPVYFFVYVSRRMRISPPRWRFPVEQRLDHIFVHVILRIIDYAILGLLLFGGIYFLFSEQAAPADLPRVILALLALTGLGFGWGIFTLTVLKKSRIGVFFFPLFNRVLILFSGVFFLPDNMQPDVRDVLSYNPLMHAIMMFRKGFYPQYQAVLLDPQYLFYCVLAVVVVGLVLERATARYEQ